MANKNVSRDIDLLRRDECKPLTTEQMADIKSQFHPSSTANVNITPYHIYDEDEHIVGEWRETINGVKKKKPVYEKTITITSFNSTGDNDIGLGSLSIEKIIKTTTIATSNENAIYPLSVVNHNGTQYSAGYFIDTNKKLSLRIGSGAGSFKSIDFTIRYTKSTDSWEEV